MEKETEYTPSIVRQALSWLDKMNILKEYGVLMPKHSKIARVLKYDNSSEKHG